MFAPIGHPDHKNVVELVHPVDLGQQLVDDGVVHLRSKLDNYKRRMKASFTPELSPPLDPRALQIASISSKMMMCRPVLMRKMMDDGDDEDICDCAGGQKSNAIVVFQFRQHYQRTEEAIMVSIKQLTVPEFGPRRFSSSSASSKSLRMFASDSPTYLSRI